MKTIYASILFFLGRVSINSPSFSCMVILIAESIGLKPITEIKPVATVVDFSVAYVQLSSFVFLRANYPLDY